MHNEKTWFFKIVFENLKIEFLKTPTEDWSNDAENSALITGIHYILKYIQIQNGSLNCNNISLYYCLYCILVK